MIDVVGTYILVLVLFQPIEELHNCNNPNTIGIVPHCLCKWEEDDFFTYKGKKYLRLKDKDDNLFEKHYRYKYWEVRGYYIKKRR